MSDKKKCVGKKITVLQVEIFVCCSHHVHATLIDRMSSRKIQDCVIRGQQNAVPPNPGHTWRCINIKVWITNSHYGYLLIGSPCASTCWWCNGWIEFFFFLFLLLCVSIYIYICISVCENDQSDTKMPHCFLFDPNPSLVLRLHRRPTLNFKQHEPARLSRRVVTAGCDAALKRRIRKAMRKAVQNVVMGHSNFPHEWQISLIAPFDQDRMVVLFDTHIGNGTLEGFFGGLWEGLESDRTDKTMIT